ncbi:hypothetical protein [Nocardia wallacei]|nr:hypothetical protein [Nocardia wallacei]
MSELVSELSTRETARGAAAESPGEAGRGCVARPGAGEATR